VCVAFYHGGGGGVGGGHGARKVCYFWVHTAFLSSPPAEMGGVAQAVPDAERVGGPGGWWLPPGTESLTLRKHEVQRPAPAPAG
jgi:hypothetical protein